MTVTTTRLVLRKPSETDLEAIFEVHSDPETNVYNPAGPMKGPSETVSRLEEWTKGWLEHGYDYWSVARLDRPETVVGFGGVMRQITPELFDNNLYFRFRPEAWGQGYAGELVEAALEHTFNTANQTRVLGMTRERNTASRKTMERAGLEQVGVVDDVSGAALSVLYALERETYLTRKASPESTYAMPSVRQKLKQYLYNRRFRADVRAAGRRTDQPLLKPDFLGIGTARSASTWLHSRLSQHPDVYLPELKELHFFNEPREHTACDVSGATWTRPLYFDLGNPAHWRWYSQQFAPGADKVKGEITPDYSTLSQARVGEIKHHLPDVKIILLIRNPIDRAWSGLRYSWKRHLDETLKPGEVEALMRAALHPERLLRGDYPMTLTNWEAHFPASQRLYVFYDDVAAQPSTELGRVADFLGVDPAKLSQEGDSRRVNDAPAETIPSEVRERLRAHYEPQILWLQERFGRDLSGWLEPSSTRDAAEKRAS